MDKHAFFSAKNRKIYENASTISVQKYKQADAKYVKQKNAPDEYQEYMMTLQKMNKGQEDLMDNKKYFISPNRYGSQIPWKLMQSPFGK